MDRDVVTDRPNWLMISFCLIVGAMIGGALAFWWHSRHRGRQGWNPPVHGLSVPLNRLHEVAASPWRGSDSEMSLLERRSGRQEWERPSLREGWGEEVVKTAELHRPSKDPDEAPDEQEIKRATWNFPWSNLL